MEENLAYPLKKIVVKLNELNSFWYDKKIFKEIPKSIKPGDFVKIFSKNGKFLGTGYVNLNSKIGLRVLIRDEVQITKRFIEDLIIKANEKRKNLQLNSYRVVHSEADFLSGLIVDRYNDIFVIQINTAGMENLRNFIISSVINIFDPHAIYEKSDEKMREIEGLINSNGLIYGEDVKETIIEENEAKFFVNFNKSQKTGFYLDQRENRRIIGKLAKNKKVLDLFCHTGGFGIHCTKNGAEFVKFVDISKNAIELLKRNLTLNEIKNFKIVNQNVFKFLENETEKYDLIIIDPPPFAKTQSEKKGALKGYKFLLAKSFELLNENGIIALFSCSYIITINDLIEIVKEISIKNNPNLIMKKILFQDFSDHTYLISCPNTLYLKGLLFQRLSF